MRFRCPNCQNLFEMDVLPSSGRTQCPTCNQPVKVGPPPTAPAPRIPLAPDPDFKSIPHGTYQPQTLPAYLTQPPPTPPRRFRHPLDDVPQYRKRSSGNALIWILALAVGAPIGLGILGILGVVLYTSGVLVGTSEMSIAGYSAKAPGRLPGANSSLEDFEVAIFNPRTASQFQLIYLENEPFARATVDSFIERLRNTSTDAKTEPVTRLGMNGVRFEAKKALGLADSEGEVYQISGGVLVVLYSRGSSLALIKGRAPKYTGEKERELDRVDDFFASLSRN